MKRFSRIFFVMMVLVGTSLQVFAKDDDRNQILKVYNWADYIDESLITEFEEWYKEQTGEDVEVIYQTFDINEVMLTKIEKGHEDYDVVCPSEYIIERMLRNNLLQPINKDFGNTPDYTKNVSPYAMEQFGKMSNSVNTNDYAVAVFALLPSKTIVYAFARHCAYSVITAPSVSARFFTDALSA